MGKTHVIHDPTFEELRIIVAPIAKKRGVEKIYLFGSRARGENEKNSDYDFYVIPGHISGMTALCGLMRELEEALGSEVDIVSEDPYTNEDLLKEVFRDRRLVYES